MALTLQQWNEAPADQALAWLDGLYEHSPWIVERAWARRPFASLAALKRALVQVVSDCGRERQVALIMDFRARVLCATPSYALAIAEVADSMGVDRPVSHGQDMRGISTRCVRAGRRRPRCSTATP